MRDEKLERAAQAAADGIRQIMRIPGDVAPTVGLVLGTGWGDVLGDYLTHQEVEVPFGKLPGFEKLGALDGHRRSVVFGRMAGMPVVALSGRVHLNESHDPEHWKMVRLQAEMLIKLGVKTLILTCAAGSLVPAARVGNIVAVDGFVTLFAPTMPLLGGEFVSPEDAIDQDLVRRIWNDRVDGGFELVNVVGSYGMVRGPFFEGRKYDKALLRQCGAHTVGMSMLPEACVAALYADEGVRVLPLAFITNDHSEEHSHEENMRRAKASAAKLGAFLCRAVALTRERES